MARLPEVSDMPDSTKYPTLLYTALQFRNHTVLSRMVIWGVVSSEGGYRAIMGADSSLECTALLLYHRKLYYPRDALGYGSS